MIRELLTAAVEGINFQPLSRTTERVEADTESKNESSFDSLLSKVLSAQPGTNVSEEELFAGLIQERIKTLKGDDALTKFQEAFASEKAAHTKADGFVAVEDAARAALRRMVTDKVLTTEEGDKVHAEAFDAAQLDENKEALFDSRGGPGDPTMAVAVLENALRLAKEAIDKFAAGTTAVSERKLMDHYDPYAGISAMARSTHQSDVSGPALPMDGANGFLFKPRSDSDGKLVVLLPSDLTGDIAGVTLKNRRGREVERGMYRGIGNGEREHFRFTRPGDDYPRNMTVEVELKNGKTKTYKIKDPSQRYD